MKKFHYFAITEILREINFVDSRSAKNFHFCHFRGCEFCSFSTFQPSKSAKIHKKSQFSASQKGKKADLALQESARILKGLQDRPSAQELTHIAEKWRPWRAVAARVLWAYYHQQKQREGI